MATQEESGAPSGSRVSVPVLPPKNKYPNSTHGKELSVSIKEFKKWVILYPIYLDKKYSLKKGRRVGEKWAIDNPNVIEITDCCKNLGFFAAIEDKRHPGDFWKRGRTRVRIRDGEGNLIVPEIPTRKALLYKIAEMIPEHHLRTEEGRQELLEKLKAKKAAQMGMTPEAAEEAEKKAAEKKEKKKNKKKKNKK